MARASRPKRGASSVVVRALLLAGWVGVCDVWLKAMARAGGCVDAPAVADWVTQPWSLLGPLPAQCPGAPLFSEAVRLAPAVRDGGPLGVLAPAFTGVYGQLWALALLALATTVTILVARWRWRDSADGLAIGTLWGGCATLALPRLLGNGAGLSEITIGGVATGIGDIAVVWAGIWLLWRAIAETRA